MFENQIFKKVIYMKIIKYPKITRLLNEYKR